MTPSFQFTFNNLHLTFFADFLSNQWQMLPGKSLENGKWSMVNSPEGALLC